MYVLTLNDQVLLGPMDWNARMFNSEIRDALEDAGLSFDGFTDLLPSDKTKVPLSLLGGVIRIREYTDVYPERNPKIHDYNGPYWSFTDSVATASFTVNDKSLDMVRGELKQAVAAARYAREITGVKVTIQGTEVSVDTARGSRDIFVQQLLLLPDDGTVAWKFPEAWLTLTKADLGACVASGVAHVQAAFNWEQGKVALIEACSTLAELDALTLAE